MSRGADPVGPRRGTQCFRPFTNASGPCIEPSTSVCMRCLKRAASAQGAASLLLMFAVENIVELIADRRMIETTDRAPEGISP